jgi:hypothetical protein
MFHPTFLEQRGPVPGNEDSELRVLQATMQIVQTPGVLRGFHQAQPDPKSEPFIANAPTRPDVYGTKTTYRRVDDGVDANGRKKTCDKAVTKTSR